jgi:hypothetical protein
MRSRIHTDGLVISVVFVAFVAFTLGLAIGHFVR